jgi:hypothetical protein
MEAVIVRASMAAIGKIRTFLFKLSLAAKIQRHPKRVIGVSPTRSVSK